MTSTQTQIDTAIGKRIQNIRVQKGLSQSNFADTLGISLRAYRNYERGERPISKKTLCELADKYGADLNWLLIGREPGNGAASLGVGQEIDSEIAEEVVRGLLLQASGLFSKSTSQTIRSFLIIYNQVCHLESSSDRAMSIRKAIDILELKVEPA